MPSSYTPRLRLELQATGENRATWGTNANQVFTRIEEAIAGKVTVAMPNTDYSLTTANGTSDQARNLAVSFTGTNTAIRTITIPSVSKFYLFNNATTGGFALNAKTAAGSTTVCENGKWTMFFCDGTNTTKVFDMDVLKLNGQLGSYYLDPANLSSVIPVAKIPHMTGGDTNPSFVRINNGLSSSTALGSLRLDAAGVFTYAYNDVTKFGWDINGVLTSGSVPTTRITGLGTAALENIGTSGANVPLMSTTNTWSGTQNFGTITATVATVGAGAAAVDGTALLTFSSDRSWVVRQRGVDAAAVLSFENTSSKSVEFSSEAVYAGAQIVINPSASPTITVAGNLVWHAGNDGPGSGLNADLLDNQSSAFYQTSTNQTAGTLPAARLSGDYDFDNLTLTGNANAAQFRPTGQEGVRLNATADPFISFYAAGVRQGYIQWSDGTAPSGGFKMLNDFTDDFLLLHNTNSIDALQWYDSSLAAYRVVYHTGNFASVDVTTALGFTPVTNARTVTAGNGMTGGGALSANITLTMGTPGSITNSSTNAVTSTSHTHALGFTAAEVYTGTGANDTNLSLGHHILINSNEVTRNALVTPALSASFPEYYFKSSDGGVGASLSGTWRTRGSLAGAILAQRVA